MLEVGQTSSMHIQTMIDRVLTLDMNSGQGLANGVVARMHCVLAHDQKIFRVSPFHARTNARTPARTLRHRHYTDTLYTFEYPKRTRATPLTCAKEIKPSTPRVRTFTYALARALTQSNKNMNTHTHTTTHNT